MEERFVEAVIVSSREWSRGADKMHGGSETTVERKPNH